MVLSSAGAYPPTAPRFLLYFRKQAPCQSLGIWGQAQVNGWRGGTKARAGRRRSGDKPRPLGLRFRNPEDGFPESGKDRDATARTQRLLDGSGEDAASTRQRCRRNHAESRRDVLAAFPPSPAPACGAKGGRSPCSFRRPVKNSPALAPRAMNPFFFVPSRLASAAAPNPGCAAEVTPDASTAMMSGCVRPRGT